ncbi:hypothetical protein BD410DRAFT_797517 [Rickenella mellea]|uniref:Uncharacterized protein n=1 Tax=Rickenella mellea TaxID=50990 RepID=A0A4Y7PEK5_9AGAM|nr:hypothetical protein BD410DRAFT_797517 [Rickenella mellea]
MDIKSETSPSSHSPSTQPQSRAPALSVSQLFIPPVLPPEILSVKFEIARKESVATSFFRYTPHKDTIPYDLDRADVLDRFYALFGLPPSITQLGWRLSHERIGRRHRLFDERDVEKAFVAFRYRIWTAKKTRSSGPTRV